MVYDLAACSDDKSASQQLLSPEIVRVFTGLFLTVENLAEVCRPLHKGNSLCSIDDYYLAPPPPSPHPILLSPLSLSPPPFPVFSYPLLSPFILSPSDLDSFLSLSLSCSLLPLSTPLLPPHAFPLFPPPPPHRCGVYLKSLWWRLCLRKPSMAGWRRELVTSPSSALPWVWRTQLLQLSWRPRYV